MKLKRILSLALSGVLAVSLMTGCFGGGTKLPGSNDVDSISITTAVNSAINSKPKFENNRTLSNAVQAAASTLTAAQVAKTDVLAPASVLGMVRQMTDTVAKTQLDNPQPWEAMNSDVKVSTVRIYDGDYDVATVANKIKTDVLDQIQLTSDNATTDEAFTCKYDCYIAACKATVADAVEDGSDVTVWVVGIQIDRDAEAKA